MLSPYYQYLLGYTVLGLTLFFFLIHWFMASLYDWVFPYLLSQWYIPVFDDMKEGETMLDVGIGTCTSLIMVKDAFYAKKIPHLVGIDYEPNYLAPAKASLEAAGMGKDVTLVCASIYDVTLAELGGKKFDTVLFSGSFTVMSDQVAALKATQKFLVDSPNSRIYATNCFQEYTLPGMSFIKPAVRWLTTVDCGRMIWAAEIQKIAEQSGMVVVKNEIIGSKGMIFKGMQQTRMLVMKPKKYA